MRQRIDCACRNGGACSNSYCPNLGRLAAREGAAPAQRDGVAALASTATVSTSAQTRRAS